MKRGGYIGFAIALIATAYVFLSYTSIPDCGYNDGDSLTHYYISRYADRHPMLFLDIWGKPLFTLISSPFSQYGFNGIKIFNIICGFLAAFFTYRTCKLLNQPRAYFAIPFLIFMPVYFVTMSTGLTEVFCSLILIAAIFLFFKEDYLLGAAFASFLPFCRSEGYFLVAVFFVALLLRKKYAALPMLALGFVVYSIIGQFFTHDFWWVIRNNPYRVSNNYGHGPFLYFAFQNYRIWGLTLAVCFIAGLVFEIYKLVKKRPDTIWASNLILLYGTALGFFAMHTIFWWKGLFASAGMIRVMAAIAPVFVVCAIIGFNDLIKVLLVRKVLAFIIIFFLSVLVFKDTERGYNLPLFTTPELPVVQASVNYINEHHIDKTSVYYTHPLAILCLDIDPYTNNEPVNHNLFNYHDIIPAGNYLLWDYNFGNREAQLPVTTFSDTATYQLVKKFLPTHPIDMGSGIIPFEVDLFYKKK